MKKRLLCREVSFYDPIQRSTIVTSLKKRKKHRKLICVLKEDCQALGSFVEKYPEKHKAFKYPLTTLPLAISTQKPSVILEIISSSYQTPKSMK